MTTLIKRTTNIHLNSEFSIKVTGMSFLYVTLVTEGALIIFFPDKKRQGALIGAGALNGANTVSGRVYQYTMGKCFTLLHPRRNLLK